MERNQQYVFPITEHVEARPLHDPLRFIDTQRHESVDLLRYLRAIRRHIRLIALVLGLGAVLAAVHLVLTPRVFTAQATLLVTAPEPDAMETRKIDVADGEEVAKPDYYKTQCDILKSRNLAARVVALLGLYGADKGMSGARAPAEPIGNSHLRRAVDAYLWALKIKPINDTSLIGIEYRSPDPELAARIANAHAEAFIQQRHEMLRRRKADIADLLEFKLVDLKRRLEASELALNNYRRDQGIIPGLMTLNGKNAIVVDRLTQLSNQLTAAQVKRLELEPQVELIHRGQYAPLPAIVADPMLQTLEHELDDLYVQDRTLSSRFTPDYPKVEYLQARIRALQTQLSAETTREVKSIELSYQSAVRAEAELDAEVTKQRSLTIALNDAGVKYAMLQREVDANRELYESVLRAMKDARLAADSQSSNVAILDRAEVPVSPSEPRVALTFAVSMILSLFAGLGAALVLDYLRDPLDEPEDVARLYRLPVFAVVPPLRLGKARNRVMFQPNFHHLSARRAGANGTIPSMRKPYATGDEAYRHLGASLRLAQHKDACVTLITSSVPSEGKTRTAVGASIALARRHKHVLLIDADLRRPRCHHYFGAQNNEGLACILEAECSPHSFVQPTSIEGLHFLCAGRASPNSTELMSPPALADIFENLRSHYEFVIVDSSPVLLISDALMLAAVVDGVILVVDSNKTSKRTVRHACSRLSQARANIIGVVLNKSIADIGYYKRYYRHYG